MSARWPRGDRGRVLAWGCVALLALAAASGERPLAGPRPALAVRLFGPIASLAASVQWVRFDAALDAGRPALAYARAASALELDPGGSEGWAYLARHFMFQRASAEVEPEPAARAEWIRAGLQLLERGERVARTPQQLALERGLVLAAIGDSDDDEATGAEGALAGVWPGGAAGAFAQAALAFERAAALGHPHGAELAAKARAAAEFAAAQGER